MTDPNHLIFFMQIRRPLLDHHRPLCRNPRQVTGFWKAGRSIERAATEMERGKQ